MKISIKILALLLCMSSDLLAQNYTTRKTATGKAKELYEKAVSADTPEKAIEKWQEALKKEPNFIDCHIKMGYTYFDQAQYQNALDALLRAIAIDPNYEARTVFFAGKAAWELEKYDIAAQYFKQYQTLPKANDELKVKAQLAYQSSQFAAEATKHPVPFMPQNLGSKINSNKLSEYLPSLTADGMTMVYTVRTKGDEDFYISYYRDSAWQQGEALTAINSEANEGAQNIAADGRSLYFAAQDRPNSLGRFDIYMAEIKSGTWSAAVNVGAPINTPHWESQPSISADGKSLYFASDRPDGKGITDIWVSHRQKNGKWGNPINLGDSINTAQREECPFIHPDGQTLYFSSEGLPGMGARDLYMVRKQSNGKWGMPINLGYPINTKGDEGTLVVSIDGKKAYFSSDVQSKTNTDANTPKNGETICLNANTDIYSFDLHEAVRPMPVTYVKAIIKDAVTQKPLIANVDFFAKGATVSYASPNSAANGEFLVCLPSGKEYGLNISKSGYVFYSDYFNLLENNSAEKPFILEILLLPLPSETTKPIMNERPTVLKNVFFETGSSALLSSSTTELERLATLLIDNPTLRIEVQGHTDNVGNDEANQLLSEQRAKAVYDFLIQKNINQIRLRYKGFGESQPTQSNDTPEGRQANRRTAFIGF